jgi:hypothetical protein
MFAATPRRPHHPGTEAPDEDEPDSLPVGPDEGPTPDHIPDEPEQDPMTVHAS